MTFETTVARDDVPVAGGMLAAYRLGGAGDETRVALAVHGITASSQSWLPVAQALGARGALIAIDLRGRGRSNQLAGPYGISTHVRDITAALDHFGLRRAVLVGHSLGAYVVARFAVEHSDRVQAVVLVDGGLPVPGSDGAEPQAFLDSLLGPALARLKLTFADREDYRDWWRRHPALADADVAAEHLNALADHDLAGTEPQLRSAVREEAVRADAADLFEMRDIASRLRVPATLLCAPRGLLDDPNPMQPLALAQAWAADAPGQRRAIQVPAVNHYTIVLGGAGASQVADAIAGALATDP